MYADGDITRERKNEMLERVDVTEREVRVAIMAQPEPMAPFTKEDLQACLEAIEGQWSNLAPDDRRTLLQTVIQHVKVWQRAKRIDIVWKEG
jgi:hypothetical protein